MSAFATGWLGCRTATVLFPQVTSFDTQSLLLNTIVSGPGQKEATSRSAVSLTPSTMPSNSALLAMCTIKGLSLGRP